MHAIVLLAHFHSLSSFVYGCGISPELEQDDGHTYRPALNDCSTSTDDLRHLSSSGGGGGGGGSGSAAGSAHTPTSVSYHTHPPPHTFFFVFYLKVNLLHSIRQHIVGLSLLISTMRLWIMCQTSVS